MKGENFMNYYTGCSERFRINWFQNYICFNILKALAYLFRMDIAIGETRIWGSGKNPQPKSI